MIDDSPQVAASFGQDLRPLRSTRSACARSGCSVVRRQRRNAASTRFAGSRHTVRRAVLGTRRYIKQERLRARAASSATTRSLDANRRETATRQDRVGFLPHRNHGPDRAIELTSGPEADERSAAAAGERSGRREDLGLRRRRAELGAAWPPRRTRADRAVESRQSRSIDLEILLDGQVVRAYGRYPDDDHGRLFRVRDPMALSRYLESGFIHAAKPELVRT